MFSCWEKINRPNPMIVDKFIVDHYVGTWKYILFFFLFCKYVVRKSKCDSKFGMGGVLNKWLVGILWH